MVVPSEWLSLTQEEAIEPGLPICDPHHHLWDHPGSCYLTEQFLRDINGGHRVLSTVFVECMQFYRTEWPQELRPVGGTESVHRMPSGAPHFFPEDRCSGGGGRIRRPGVAGGL